jgi:PHD/YefM family antitoxin component YafN of YafNO toxin-antitoxin module
MERSVSLTDLVRNAAAIAREVSTAGTVYRITRGGRGAMVLVNEEYFDGWMAAIEEMQRPDWREVLAETKRDIATGRMRSLDDHVKERGLEGPESSAHASGRKPARRGSRTRRKKSR